MSISQKLGSGQLSSGDNPRADLIYIIGGTASEATALTELENEAPDPWQGLARSTTEVEPYPDLAETWIGTATYIPVEDVEQEVGADTVRFSTGGGSEHITSSYLTVAYPGGSPDYHNLIGVTADSVEGVDIVVPKFTWSETLTVADASMTAAYIANLRLVTGKTNHAAWRAYLINEVLFLGVEGQKRGDGNWDLTYNFAAGINQTNITVAGIANVDKKAWEYIWLRYDDAVDAGHLIKTSTAVYVEKVYEDENFALLVPPP